MNRRKTLVTTLVVLCIVGATALYACAPPADVTYEDAVAGGAPMRVRDLRVSGNADIDGSLTLDGDFTHTGAEQYAAAVKVAATPAATATPQFLIQDVGAGNPLEIRNAAGTPQIRIDNAYNLKMGVATPGATHDGLDLMVSGLFEVDGVAYLDGGAECNGTLTLANDETIINSTNGTISLTVAASGNVGVATGNLLVGNNIVPDVAMDGEDAFVEGTFEVDGAARFDGAIDANSTADIAGTLTLSKGSGNALVVSAGGLAEINSNIVLQNDETIANSADGIISMTVAAGGQLGVATGNLFVGNDKIPDVAMNGEDAFVEGTFEVDGAARFDGAVDANSTGDFADTLTLSKGSGNGLVVTANADLNGDLDVDGTANLDNVDADLTAEMNIDGELVCIGATGDGQTADGDDDLIVKGDLEVDDTLDVDGDIDLDGDGFDVNITGGASIDADAASNFSASAGDITVEAETGSITLKGDEAAADAVYIDANDAVTTGLTIATGSVSGVAVTGGPFDVNVTGAISLDADAASNLSASAGNITIDAETGRVVIIGSEAAANAIHLDANDTVTSGIDIDLGSVSGMTIDGGLVDIGGGSYATANGDNDLGIAGDLEVDGAIDVDGAVDIAGALSVAGLMNYTCTTSDAVSGTYAYFDVAAPCYIMAPTDYVTITLMLTSTGVTTGTTVIFANTANENVQFAHTNIKTSDGGVLDLGQYDVVAWFYTLGGWYELWKSANS